MPESKHIEGTYKIRYMHGCITARENGEPLIIAPPEQDDMQTWEVKRVGGDKYVICLKGKDEGISYMDHPYVASPVSLGHPRPFKLREAGEDLKLNNHEQPFVVEIAESGDPLLLSVSPVPIFPQMLALMPIQTLFIWRFERV